MNRLRLAPSIDRIQPRIGTDFWRTGRADAGPFGIAETTVYEMSDILKKLMR